MGRWGEKIGTLFIIIFFIFCTLYFTSAFATNVYIGDGLFETGENSFSSKKGLPFKVPVQLDEGIYGIENYSIDIYVEYDPNIIQCSGLYIDGNFYNPNEQAIDGGTDIAIAWSAWDETSGILTGFHIAAYSFSRDSIDPGKLFELQFTSLKEGKTEIVPRIINPEDPSNEIFRDANFSKGYFKNLVETQRRISNIATMDPGDPNNEGNIRTLVGDDPNSSDFNAAMPAEVELTVDIRNTNNNAQGFKDASNMSINPNDLICTVWYLTGQDYIGIDPHAYVVKIEFTDQSGIKYHYVDNDPNNGNQIISLDVPLHPDLQAAYPDSGTAPDVIKNNSLITTQAELDRKPKGRYAIYYIDNTGKINTFIPDATKGESINVEWRSEAGSNNGLWVAKINSTHASEWYNDKAPEGAPGGDGGDGGGGCFVNTINKPLFNIFRGK